MAAHYNVHIHASHIPGTMWPQIHFHVTHSCLSCRWSQTPTRTRLPSRTLLDLTVPDWTSPATVQCLLQAGLAKSTQRTYLASKKKYLSFCQSSRITPLPASEGKLMNFVAALVEQGLREQTLSVSSAAPTDRVWRWRPQNGEHAPSGTHAAGSEAGASRGAVADPATSNPSVLEKLRRVWNRDPSNPRHVMLWAACRVAFFGFLRSGELESGEFDPGQHLAVSDVKVDNSEELERVSLRIKQSKTDPFQQGMSIHLHRTDLLRGITARLPGGERDSGRPLGRRVPTNPHTAGDRGEEGAAWSTDRPGEVCRHTFRIGAATTAAACGVPVEVIKHWEAKHTNST